MSKPTAYSSNLSRVIKLMIIAGVLGMAYVILKSCSTPKTGLMSYNQGSLNRLEIIPSPPKRPDTVFTGPEGQDMTLAEFKGDVILVNFWATWCAPCVAEMPSLSKLQSHYADEDFQVVAISLNFEREPAREFLERLQITNLPLYHEGTHEIKKAAQVRGLPVSILYNANGRELARISGEVEWDSPEAKALIDSVLGR